MSREVAVPVGRIIKLVAKTVRFSRGGFTKAERRELGLDLLELAAHVLDDILEDPQKELFDAVDRPDALR